MKTLLLCLWSIVNFVITIFAAVLLWNTWIVHFFHTPVCKWYHIIILSMFLGLLQIKTWTVIGANIAYIPDYEENKDTVRLISNSCTTVCTFLTASLWLLVYYCFVV